jgi:two-component system, LytTR family, response regulator
MKTTCLIIDDEKLARDLVREYLLMIPDLELLGECSKGTEAVEQINNLKPDLIFLDVQMPGMNGFEVLEEIEHQPNVIFITAYDQHAIKAFEKNAVDYLLKPLDEDRLRTAVLRAQKRKGQDQSNVDGLMESLRPERKSSYDTHIFVQKSEKLFNLAVDDILFLEASGDYTVITTKSDQYVSSSGIGRLEELLIPDIFFRVHRSTIINIHHLKEIEKHFNGGMIAKMHNGKTFPVSRTYAKMIRRKVV